MARFPNIFPRRGSRAGLLPCAGRLAACLLAGMLLKLLRLGEQRGGPLRGPARLCHPQRHKPRLSSPAPREALIMNESQTPAARGHLLRHALRLFVAGILCPFFVSACQQRAATDTPPHASERPAQAEGPDAGSGKEKQSLWTIEDPNEWRDCLMSKMDAESGAEEASEKSEGSQPPLVKNEAAPEWIFKPCPLKVEASASDKKELAHALVNLYDWRGFFLRESRESAAPIASPEVKIPDSVWSPDGLIAESSLDLPNNRLLSELRARYKKADQVERLDLGFGLLTLVIDECILSGNSEDTARAWAFVDFYALHEECEYPYASYICGYLTRSKIADTDRCKPYWLYEKDQHYKQYRKFILSLRALHE